MLSDGYSSPPSLTNISLSWNNTHLETSRNTYGCATHLEHEGIRLCLQFHHLGDAYPLRSAALQKVRAGKFDGRDYCGRHITLEFLETKMYCDTCRGYHKV